MKSNEYRFGRYTVEVRTDESPQGHNPRDWSNVGVMTCFHRRYKLGDENKRWTIEDLKRFIEDPNTISLPLYLYDHSGITMSTKPFSCRWDSGQVGYIWTTVERARKEYGDALPEKELRETVLKVMQQEVETYDAFIRGDVFWYVVKDENGDVVDSCGGFVGEAKYCLEEGIASAKHFEEEALVKDAIAKGITFPRHDWMIGAKS